MPVVSIIKPDDRHSQTEDLTKGSVGRLLLRLTWPMLIAHFSVVAFNLTDTYFVARLGTDELAAMGFMFPVIMLLGSLTVGLGIGTSSVLSRAIGRGSGHRVRQLATHALAGALVIVAIFAAAGLLTIRPLFFLLGASGNILGLIDQYMTIWYASVVFLVVPMVGNHAIRATGDTIWPSVIMVLANVLNIVLDPVLIFGLGGAPAMGIAGAAAATGISRAAALAGSLAVLHFRKRLLTLERPGARQLWQSWREILSIAVPAAGTIIFTPLAMGAITRIGAMFGNKTVAAIGAGSRVEIFAMMAIVALAGVLVPLIGQNWGAGQLARVRGAQHLAMGFALLWGAAVAAGLFLAARPLAKLFSDDGEVISQLSAFLRIVPLGYGLMGVVILACSGMNAINRPLQATALSAIRLLGLYVPLAAVGAWLVGPEGIFAAIALANVLAGSIAVLWVRHVQRGVSRASASDRVAAAVEPSAGPGGYC